VDQRLLDEQKFDVLTDRATRFREEVAKGRAI
jgi:hypothetical protein